MRWVTDEDRYRELYGHHTVDDIPRLVRELREVRQRIRAMEADPAPGNGHHSGPLADARREAGDLDRCLADLKVWRDDLAEQARDRRRRTAKLPR